MRRMLTTGLAAALAASACAFAAEGKAPADKRTTGELLKALSDEVPYERLRAAKALAASGREVLPALVKALKDKDWRVRRGATDALREMKRDANSAVGDLAKALTDSDAWVRDGAAAALGRMGPDAKSAARALAKAVTDDDVWVRETAIAALRSATKDKDILLPAAVAAMRVRHTSWRVRSYAVGILRQHGKGYKPAAAALVDMLEHPSEGMWDCTQGAVDVLIALDAGDKAVPVLVKMLRAQRIGERINAARSLGKIGAKARPAAGALKAVADKDADKRVRAAAAEALGKIEARKPTK